MRSIARNVGAVVLVAALTLTVETQTGVPYVVQKSVIANGGSQASTGGQFSVDGTAGQSIAGQQVSQGRYGGVAGFWTPPNQLPTAATISIAGRVLTSDGRGIRNARIQLADGDGNSRTAVTGPFGYYLLTEVPAGHICVVTVLARHWNFSTPPRVVNTVDSLSDVNFVAEP